MTPTAQIEVIGARQAIELTAVVDTGFSGDVCVPTRIAVQLGIELFSEQLVEFADGSQKNELVFAGSVRFLGKTREVEILLTASEDALIGARLLNHYAMAIDFPGGQVRVRSRRKTGGRRGGASTK